MHSNWWIDLMMYAIYALYILLGYTLAKRRLIGQYPSLFATCILTLAAQAALIIERPHYTIFFWIYWSGNGILCLFRLWIMADVLAAIPGFNHLSVSIRSIIFGLIIAISAGSGWVAVKHDPRLYIEIQQWMLMSSTAVNCASVTLMLLFFLWVFVMGLGWLRRPHLIACGLAQSVIFTYLSSLLLSRPQHSLQEAGTILINLAEIVCVAIWVLAVSHTELPITLNPRHTEIVANLSRLLTTGKREPLARNWL